jgi:hypothetical protein
VRLLRSAILLTRSDKQFSEGNYIFVSNTENLLMKYLHGTFDVDVTASASYFKNAIGVVTEAYLFVGEC